MRSTVPCPVCLHTLTVIANPRSLGCPFCRATIPNKNGRIPVGEKVRCRRCRGVFTAEEPPPEIRIFASIPEPCPVCQVVLAVRKDLPAGRKVKCGSCGTKFVPTRDVEALLAPPPEPLEQPAQGPPEPIPPVPQAVAVTYLAPRKPASRTRLGARQHTGRSSITHLAMDPLEETVPPKSTPTIPPVAEDEIDLLNTDLGIDLEFPREKPTRPQAKRSPDVPMKVQTNDKRLSPDRAEGTPTNHADRPHPAAPAKPPHREPAGNRAAATGVDPHRRPVGVLGKKKRRRAEQPATARLQTIDLVEVAAGDVQVVDDEPVARQAVEQIEMPAPAGGAPLSYQSSERQAAAALLDDAPAEQDEQETDPAMPEAAQQLAQAPSAQRPFLAPIVMPQPAPALARPAALAPAPTTTIGAKKIGQYAGSVLAVAALVFGVYYLFMGRGPGRLTVYKTEGVVICDGDPEGLRVMLHPERQNKRQRYYPTGRVGKDGKFTLTTYVKDDGAPAGRYKVVINRHIDMDDLAELKKNNKTPDEIAEFSRLIEDHPINALACAEARSTDQTVEIVAGKDNQLEFKFK